MITPIASREQLDLFVVALKQVATHSPGEFWTEALKLAGRVAQNLNTNQWPGLKAGRFAPARQG